MAETLDDLVEALMSIEDDDGEKRSTSLRLPASVHHAALLATALGMDDSLTSATANALVERVRAFARQQAFSQHFARFPEDLPSLGAVTRRRVAGSEHPAAAHPDLIDKVAAWVEDRRPGCMRNGLIDDAVDEVLGHVEVLAAGVGRDVPRQARAAGVGRPEPPPARAAG